MIPIQLQMPVLEMIQPLYRNALQWLAAGGTPGADQKRRKVQQTSPPAKDATDVELSFRAGFLTLFSSGFSPDSFTAMFGRGYRALLAGSITGEGGKYFDCLAALQKRATYPHHPISRRLLGPDFSANKIIHHFCASMIKTAPKVKAAMSVDREYLRGVKSM